MGGVKVTLETDLISLKKIVDECERLFKEGKIKRARIIFGEEIYTFQIANEFEQREIPYKIFSSNLGELGNDYLIDLPKMKLGN